MSVGSVKTNITFGLQEFLMLLLQSAVVVVTLLLFTRGLATKEDISRVERRIEILEQRIESLDERFDTKMNTLGQNYINHLSIHHVANSPQK
jgi:CII-binding regulator of phage lambda lysogenization HflD